MCTEQTTTFESSHRKVFLTAVSNLLKLKKEITSKAAFSQFLERCLLSVRF